MQELLWCYHNVAVSVSVLIFDCCYCCSVNFHHVLITFSSFPPILSPFSSLSNGMARIELTLKPATQQNSPPQPFYHDLNFKMLQSRYCLMQPRSTKLEAHFCDHLGLPVVTSDSEAFDHYISNVVKHIAKLIKSDFLTPSTLQAIDDLNFPFTAAILQFRFFWGS